MSSTGAGGGVAFEGALSRDISTGNFRLESRRARRRFMSKNNEARPRRGAQISSIEFSLTMPASAMRWCIRAELCRKIGDGVNQAADLISATASIPSLNFIPLTTFGNWF
jgi:hypothetical protein